MNDLKGIIEDCNKSDLVSDKVIKKVIEIIGQEEWQILHDENNDVCTTMGELIITLKGITELENENAELKRQVEQKQHLADVRLEQSLENYKLFSDERKARIDVDIALDDTTDQLTYAKTIIQDLLDNTDEYARQRAEDFLKENK